LKKASFDPRTVGKGIPMNRSDDDVKNKSDEPAKENPPPNNEKRDSWIEELYRDVGGEG
jgi:hypothetical protein